MDDNAGSSVGRRWAKPLAASGQLHGRHWNRITWPPTDPHTPTPPAQSEEQHGGDPHTPTPPAQSEEQHGGDPHTPTPPAQSEEQQDRAGRAPWLIQLCDGMRQPIRHKIASYSLCGYCGAVEAVTLSDLGPIIAAVLGPMLLFVAASMRYQHVDSTKTRELITKSIEKANKENRKLIDGNRRLIDRNCDLIEKSNKDTRDLIGKSNKETREPHRQEPRRVEQQPLRRA